MDQTETDNTRKDPKKWELMCATTGSTLLLLNDFFRLSCKAYIHTTVETMELKGLRQALGKAKRKTSEDLFNPLCYCPCHVCADLRKSVLAVEVAVLVAAPWHRLAMCANRHLCPARLVVKRR